MGKCLVTVRACAAQVFAALLAAMLCGCFSLSLTHESVGMAAKDPLGGKYSVKNVERQLAEALRREAPQCIVFTEDDAFDAVPLKVSVSDVVKDADTTSAVQCLPGLLTLCTVPALKERSISRTVSISSPLGKHDIGINIVGRETVCWTPLGWMPFAYPLDGYDYTGGDLMETWQDDKKATWDRVTVNAVAKAVISTLTKDRYEACIRKMEENLRRKRNAEEARHQELVLQMAESGWTNEAMLRDFALSEASVIWEVIIELRAESSIRKDRLNQLRSTLAGFGRDAEYDADLIKSQDEYDVVRAALVQIFRRLEAAYILNSKSAALVESANVREKITKAVEACSRIAIDQKKKVFGE